MSSSNPHLYRADIDGLRAIAVAIVVAFHAHLTGFDGGFVGVDVFFVISGYLITKLLVNELERTGTLSFAGFYAKRFKRLYPALLFLLTAVIALWCLFFLGIEKETRLFVKSVQYSVFGFANFFFMNNTGGYFDGAAEEMPLLHFWSLAVEEQFYFIWPLLLWGASRLKWLGASVARRSLTALAALSVLSFILTQYLLSQGQQPQAFYMMLPRAWELGLGGMLALSTLSLPGPRTALAVSVVGAGLILYPVTAYSALTVFPGLSAAVPALGTALLILAGTGHNSWVQRALSSRLMVKVGLLSYGWYLWHWPFLALLRVHYLGEIPPLKWRLLACVVSLAMAEVSLRWVEKPVRYGEFFQRLKNGKLIALTLSLSLVLAVGISAVKSLERALVSDADRRIQELARERSNAKIVCDGSLKAQASCFYGHDLNGPAEIILWGDSHARAFFPMLKAFSQQEGVRATLATRTSLLGLAGVDQLHFAKQGKPYQLEGLNRTIQHNIASRIKEGPSKKISVMLVSRWPAYSGAQPISVKNDPIYLLPEKDQAKTRERMEAALRQTLQSLFQAGVHKVAIMLPYPEYKYHVLQCKQGPRCDTPRADLATYHAPVIDLIKRVAADFPRVHLLDPVPVFCDDLSCPQVVHRQDGPLPVVYDHDHPSVSAAVEMGQVFSSELKWLIE